MKPYPTEQAVSRQDAYEQGYIDADTDDGIDILLDTIGRAQAFRIARGRRLRSNTLARLGLSDLISVN